MNRRSDEDEKKRKSAIEKEVTKMVRQVAKVAIDAAFDDFLKDLKMSGKSHIRM